LQHGRVGADILEADVAKAERPRDLDEVERVRNRRVVARQHEDEVHGGRAACDCPEGKASTAMATGEMSPSGVEHNMRLCRRRSFC
jgi:hypothetical protein